MSSPLRQPPFRWLAIASTVSRLGSAIAPVALAFAILDLTGSVTGLGVVVGARSIALVAFLLLSGVVADRLPRGLVLVGSSLASAVTQGVVAVLIAEHVSSIVVYAALSAVNGAVSAFAGPASQALIPQTVPVEQLVNANAVVRLGINGASVVGASVAGLVVVTWGSGWGIAIDAASFAVAALFFAAIRVPDPPVEPADASVLHDLRAGWGAFVSQTWLWVVVAAFLVINAALAGGFIVLGPAIADDTFGRKGWGVVLAAETVGFVVGGLIALRWRPSRLLLTGMLCMLVAVLPVAGLAAGVALPVLVGLSFISGVGIEQFGVSWQTAMHQHVPADLMARVSSYDSLGSFLAIPIGELAVGPISGLIGITPTLWLATVLAAAAAAAALLSRSVRTLRAVTMA